MKKPTKKKVWLDLGKRPLIVASLGGDERLVDSARRAEKLGADLLEIRIDSLKPKERANIGTILRAVNDASSCPMIITVRSTAEQGPTSKSTLDLRERRIIFEDAMPFAEAVDIEIESHDIREHVLSLARNQQKKVILSYHDFDAIPRLEKLQEIFHAFEKNKGDILKVAGMAKCKEDVLKLFGICQSLNNIHRVFIGMGEFGRISRVAGFLYGSALSYGYMNRPTAPGQLSVEELTELLPLFYPASRER